MLTTSPKQQAQQLLDGLDEDASFEDIQYELYVLQRIERGLGEVEAGESVSREEGRERLSKWLGSTSEIDG